ncbi:MAG: hypothetical protein GY811_27565 [Myxococcales bacterium]|nr:hypothetical protein [Myxococcales bacterium]
MASEIRRSPPIWLAVGGIQIPIEAGLAFYVSQVESTGQAKYLSYVVRLKHVRIDLSRGQSEGGEAPIDLIPETS